MTLDRERLPDRRPALNYTFVHANTPYEVTIGFYPDGRPGEVFVSGYKVGAALQHMLVDAGIFISFALQRGATLEELRHSVAREEAGAPSSLIGLLVEFVFARVAELAAERAVPA